MNFNKEIELLKIYSEAKKLAINALNEFCKKLNVDSNILEDIYNVDVKIDYLTTKDDANYFPHGNIIVINHKYLEKMANIVEKDKNKLYGIICNIEYTIIHEMLHAIRKKTIIFNEKNKINNGIEEILTDTIADIIVRTQHDEQLDINKVTSRIIAGEEYGESNIIGAKIVNAMGEDLFKWFMTSQYYKLLEDRFGDDYNYLVSYSYNIYNSENNINDDFVNTSNIIDKIANRKKM